MACPPGLAICNAYTIVSGMKPLYPLLGLLCLGEAHGYELKRIAERDFAPYWRIDFAQLYRTLADAQRAGLVTVRSAAGSSGPARKIYAMTARGREVFSNWVNTPASGREERLVKAGLALAGAGMEESWQRAERERARVEFDDWRRRRAAAAQSGDEAWVLLASAALSDARTAMDALDRVRPARGPAKATRGLTIVGSDDPMLSKLARAASLPRRVTGSYGGLWALVAGEADVAALHLRDPETGEYNAPFLRRMLPEDDLVVVNMAWRDTGLIIARGNPMGITSALDLTRPGVRLINRQAAAGTRLLLYMTLRHAGVDPATLTGWDTAVSTHDAVARAVARGKADVGPGLRATAEHWDLGFLPLARERYDLAMRRSTYDSPGAGVLLKALRRPAMRQWARGLAGYDVASSGDAAAVAGW